MNKSKLARLLQEYFDNTISETELIELLNYLNVSETDDIIDIIKEEMHRLQDGPEFSGLIKHDVWQQIQSDPRFIKETLPTNEQPKVIKLYRKNWLKAVAAILIVSASLGLFLLNRKIKTSVANVAQNQLSQPIVPGGNKATLTLSTGKVIQLDTANNGLIASAGKAQVLKKSNAQLVYDAHPSSADNREPVYNILSTPKGGVFQVVLPDGTKVWLNSASSLKFPIEFTGNERRVSLTGEAYFEVAKNKDKPFFVDMNNVQVRVLGTHFNIAAYQDDNNITTTLLEGAVQVKSNNQLSAIKPGEQAVIDNNTNAISIKAANIEEVMAWKNGYFKFADEDIRSIMKKLSRWYDFDVEYHDELANVRLGGTFYRSKGINELLSYMEEVGKIHFKVEGRRIIVMK
jgi:hypothetical protein